MIELDGKKNKAVDSGRKNFHRLNLVKKER